jgi:hypothetical protein
MTLKKIGVAVGKSVVEPPSLIAYYNKTTKRVGAKYNEH